MTVQTLRLLLAYLPDEALQTELGQRVLLPSRLQDAEAVRFTTIYSAQDIGWLFVHLLHRHRIPFPGGLCFGDDEVLFRAYMYLENSKLYRSPDVQHALAIRAGGLTNMRTTLEGLLLVPSNTCDTVAALTRLPVETVRAYERLFFNVVDRRDDVLYLQQIVYPHGRLVEMLEGYFERESLGALVRRAGYQHGSADVMYFMGSSDSALQALDSSRTVQDFERMVMSVGYVMARNGGAHQRATAVVNAKQLVQAGKLGGESTSDAPLDGGLSSTLTAEVTAFARPARILTAEAEVRRISG